MVAPLIKHAFVSAKADGVDATLIQPSAWNSNHALTVSQGSIVGANAAGAAQELVPTSDFTITTGVFAHSAAFTSSLSAVSTQAAAALPKAGGTMTGAIVLAADPAAPLQPATKQYVDAGIAASATPTVAVATGLVVKNNTGAPTTQINITADSAILVTSAGIPKLWTGGTLTCNTAVNGANGLDTASRTSSTWYNLFLIYNPTSNTFASLASLSATAPTLPSGYTYTMRVGAVYSGSGNTFANAVQRGNRTQYSQIMVEFNGGQSWSALTLVLIPPTATIYEYSMYFYQGTSASIAPSTSYQNNYVTGFNFLSGGNSGLSGGTYRGSVLLETPQQVAYYATGGGSLQTLGWSDKVNAT